MALIECRECKQQVSDQAKTCPHCGIDNPGKRPDQGKKKPIRTGKFMNPANGYIERIGAAVPLVWLLGPLYIAIRGLWGHALIILIINLFFVFTLGVAGMVMAFLVNFFYGFAFENILRSHYLGNGWEEVA